MPKVSSAPGKCDVWPNLFYVSMHYCLVLRLQQSNQTSHFFLQEYNCILKQNKVRPQLFSKVSNGQNENKTTQTSLRTQTDFRLSLVSAVRRLDTNRLHFSLLTSSEAVHFLRHFENKMVMYITASTLDGIFRRISKAIE